jgi:putative ABC transport system substrate-binding protein
MMRRRDFVALVGGVAVARPLGARAQSREMPVVGFLNSASQSAFTMLVAAFRRGLGEMGFVEGQNIKIEYRWADGQYDRLNEMAAELAKRRVDVIAATGGAFAARAAMAASKTIPIVFISGPDPVQAGLVASINRPGGNATGVTVDTTEMMGKRLEMLLELVPKDTKVAMLVSSAPTVEKLELEFVERNGLVTVKLGGGRGLDKSEYEKEFEAAFEHGAGAFLVSADPFFTDRRNLIVALATRHALPAVYPWRLYALAGGLMSYGPSIDEAYRQIGRYAGRILKGAKPSELPVQAPDVFDLVINLKTAKALGLSVPRVMLARANELIE